MNTSTYQGMSKLAHQAGVTSVLGQLGLSDGMEKDAVIGAIVRGLAGAGKFLATKGVGLARAGAARAGAEGAGTLAKGVGGAQGFVGRMGAGVGRNLSSAGYAFGRNPMGTVGRGALNFGKGAIGMGGKGIGGKLGTGTFAASMGSMLLSPGGTPMPRVAQGAAGMQGMGAGASQMGYGGSVMRTNPWTNPYAGGY